MTKCPRGLAVRTRWKGPASAANGRHSGRWCDPTSDRQELWSPQEIAQRLRIFPDDPEMRVSHETIYQSLFVHGRGELRRALARCLRSGRAVRKRRGGVERSTRVVLLQHLEHGRGADAVDAAMRKAIASLRAELVRSITWDQGKDISPFLSAASRWDRS